MTEIIWMPSAKKEYNNMVDDVLDKWGVDTAIKLIDNVNNKLSLLEQHNYLPSCG